MASKPIAQPADLRAAGITPAAWKQLDNSQRREVIHQSRLITREAQGKGAPAGTPAATERERRTATRAKRLADLPKDKTFAFWHKYGKADEGPEFWAMYNEYAYGIV